ncbi:MAG: hypothetical protein ACRDRG_08740 [Pseudonocardiaceae bacterium]
MLAIPYLLLSFLAALVIVQRVFREFPVFIRLVGAFVVSIVLTGWLNFIAGWLIHSLGRSDATFYGAFVAMGVNALFIGLGWRQLQPGAFRVRAPAVLGVSAAVALSGWVMHTRLSGDPLTVSNNTWGDTALHIGIARSFSEGDNFPPTLPVLSGEKLRYHFGLDFYAGALERMGLPLEWAFNLPGVLGFAAIMVLIVEFAHYLWRRVSIGVIAAVLFVTNSSLAFLRYFDEYPSVTEALKPSSWWNHGQYLATAPYQGGGEQISIFWTLNPYVNQTHLIVSMALFLFVGYALLQHLRGPGGIAGDPLDAYAQENHRRRLPRQRAVALGLLSGAAFCLNGLVFLGSMIFFCVLLYLYSGHLRRVAVPSAVLASTSATLFIAGAFLQSDGIRKVALVLLIGGFVLLGPVRESLPLFAIAGVVALPQMISLTGGLGTENALRFHNGYLVESFRFQDPGSYLDFTNYWWLNLGLVAPLVILAAIIGRRADRKLLIAIMAIFAFGNIVAFSPDLGVNHKVFNLWETLVNLFAAYALVVGVRVLWRDLPARSGRLGTLAGRATAIAVTPVAGVVLVFSGLLDFMTLKNDTHFAVFWEPAVSWIKDNTSRDSVFLTAYGDVYTLPTLAGRSVYFGGFSGWSEAMGYHTMSRERTIASIYAAPDRATACERMRGTGVDYIQVGDGEKKADRFPHRNPDLFPGDFVRVYSDAHFAYYDVRASCPTGTITATSGP